MTESAGCTESAGGTVTLIDAIHSALVWHLQSKIKTDKRTGNPSSEWWYELVVEVLNMLPPRTAGCKIINTDHAVFSHLAPRHDGKTLQYVITYHGFGRFSVQKQLVLLRSRGYA